LVEQRSFPPFPLRVRHASGGDAVRYFVFSDGPLGASRNANVPRKSNRFGGEGSRFLRVTEGGTSSLRAGSSREGVPRSAGSPRQAIPRRRWSSDSSHQTKEERGFRSGPRLAKPGNVFPGPKVPRGMIFDLSLLHYATSRFRERGSSRRTAGFAPAFRLEDPIRWRRERILRW
jgi:hypothetical protein